MFTVADTVAIATHLRSSALLWLPTSCFVPCIADLPRNIRKSILVRQRSLPALQQWYFANGRWMTAGHNQQGHEQVKDQLKPMNITQVLAVSATASTV